MLWQFQAARTYNVKDMYNQSKTEDKPLLSIYNSDFWAGYRSNYQHLDRLFMKKYASLIPLDQDYEAGLADITNDFRFDVYSFLLANDKRYSELFRVNSIVDDEAYSLTNNVDYTETTSRDIEFNKGSQANSDEGFTAYGSQEITEDKSKTIGSQENTEDLERTYGATSGTDTTSVSAYNSATYDPAQQLQKSTTQHIDSEDNTKTYGSREDTEDNTITHGSHRDDTTNIHNEGSRQDITDEDITVHKVGNMGVQTVDDMLKKHWDNWNLFDFYGLIFEEIAATLLRGC